MAAQINLDLDTLRTFAVAHDFGGFAQAVEQLRAAYHSSASGGADSL